MNEEGCVICGEPFPKTNFFAHEKCWNSHKCFDLFWNLLDELEIDRGEFITRDHPRHAEVRNRLINHFRKKKLESL